MEGIAIKVEHLSKVFKLPHEKNNSIKSATINFYRRKKTYELQQALNDISFEIKNGEFFGIVGRNGSGKSTLLKLLAGIYSPTSGGVSVKGKLTPFIELGVGFNPELTGRENVYLNGALLGFNRKEIKTMYKDIVKFAELEKFMDQRLKNYSSGMQVRLAFSIAIRAQSDILLIDEVLAVGDAAFQEKCFDYFRQLKKEKRTVVFVTHDLNSVQEFCDRAAIVDRGILKSVGGANEIVRRYETIIADTPPPDELQKNSKRPGTGEVIITKVELLNKDKTAAGYISDGEPFTIQVAFQSKKVADVVVGIAVTDLSGVALLGPNTLEAKLKIPVSRGGKKTVNAHFTDHHLSTGSYIITAGVFHKKGLVPMDYFEAAAKFKILGEKSHGKINSRPSWSVS